MGSCTMGGRGASSSSWLAGGGLTSVVESGDVGAVPGPVPEGTCGAPEHATVRRPTAKAAASRNRTSLAAPGRRGRSLGSLVSITERSAAGPGPAGRTKPRALPARAALAQRAGGPHLLVSGQGGGEERLPLFGL